MTKLSYYVSHPYAQLKRKLGLLERDQSEPAGMSSAQAPFSEPVYATPKEPRELTAEDLAFISKYTGRPAETLRRHILDVWNSAKKQVSPANVFVLTHGLTFPVPDRHCGMPSCFCERCDRSMAFSTTQLLPTGFCVHVHPRIRLSGPKDSKAP